MPSSPNYVRDYKHEDAIETSERKKQRAMRNAARRAYEKASGPIPEGYDVDHIKPLSKGGGNKGNLQLQRASSNRSYARTRTGAMKGKHD